MKHVIVGTAGHIDHGKSALIEALTGTHPDRLEEEKRRGITIDLGFAFLKLADVEFGFVDVPGHERFVKNMLAGAWGIDIVLLIVAADESIKPQTREHFDICRLLGVEHGIVVVSKKDLVDEEALGLVKLEIEEFVRGSFLENAPVVSVSARTGAGIEELKSELLRVARAAPARDPSGRARLPIDRAFVMQGFGTVVTGTLVSGSLRTAEEVEIFPTGQRARVRGLHSGGRAVEEARAGQRTAVNISGIDLEEVRRGMVLAAPESFRATERLDARIALLPSARGLKNRSRVHFHQGTAEAVAEVILLDREQLMPGESALAQLRLDQKILALPRDRFILRQFSPLVTIGGGVVVDALAPRHRKREAGIARFLETLETGRREEIVAALAASGREGSDLRQLVARTGWLEKEIRDAAGNLSAQGRIRVVSERPLLVVSSEAVSACAERLGREVERFHGGNPLLPGIPKEELRERVAANIPLEMFLAALGDLVAAGKAEVNADVVRRAGREITLRPEEARAKEQMAREFERAGLAAPATTEVLGKVAVESSRAQKLLLLLIREGVLVKVTEELVLHRAAIERLRSLLANYKREQGNRLPIAAFKQLAGVSRKYAIPLLEYLDRERLTRRAGDERVIL